MAASIIRNGDGFDSHGASAPKSWWQRSSLPRPLSVLITIAATAYAYHLVRALASRANQLDFSHYYVSALMMRQGLDPYITDIKPLATLLRLQVHDITLATYPPTFLLLFEPLTLLPPTWAFWLWTATGAAFLGGTLYMLLDGLPQHTGLRLSLVGLVILYPPITANFVWGQSQLMLLFFFVLFMRLLNCGRQSWAGAIAGLAGLLKIFPLLLLGYLAIRRQWKAILYAGMVLIAGGILTLTFVGVGTSADFVSAVPSITSQRWLGRDTNVALGAIVSHIFWYSAAHHLGPLAGIGAHLEPGTDLVRRVMVSIAEFVVLALTVSATFRTSSGSLRSSESGDESVIALWAVSAIMLTPTAWIHYLVILLIPYAVLLRGELNGEAAPLAARLGLASFVVGELMLTVDLMPAIVPSSATLKLQDIEFWATLIGWPICLLLAYAAIYLQALGTKRRPAQPAAIAEAAQAASS